MGMGTRRRRAAGHRPGTGLLPAGDAAPPPRRPGDRDCRGRRRALADHRPGVRRPSRTGERTEMIRIGNCSGFYGDRFAAMREMLQGGELDVLTGDYLAELTMLILARDRLKDPE